ncbi:MAG TPA: DUF4062 domain-containing protein [Gammaproteobacteria bacterium]|nr:DUF4062 domain-containing protein [Gammaproteobacteria bacterium]
MAPIQILRIVVASPGDVQAERDALTTVVEELNRGIAGDRSLRLEFGRWETDAYPGFHPEGPQGLIDSVLNIQDCDVLIGIFWKRFGTPVKDAGSGTEHEFLRAYEAWRAKGRPQSWSISIRGPIRQSPKRRLTKGAKSWNSRNVSRRKDYGGLIRAKRDSKGWCANT